MPAIRVGITPYAEQQVNALRGADADRFDDFRRDLAARGCEALDYRLTGAAVERLCSRHLRGRYRALVCFPEEDLAVVLLVGEHDDSRPEDNIYALLYRLLGLPIPTESRTKPDCCGDDGSAPVDHEIMDALSTGLRNLRAVRTAEQKRRRRTSRRRRR